MDRPILDRTLAGKAKARFPTCQSPKCQLRCIAADFGAMLEAVAGSGTNKNDVGPGWVPVDQEVAIGAVFILADASFDQLRTRHTWKAAAHIGADICKTFRGG